MDLDVRVQIFYQVQFKLVSLFFSDLFTLGGGLGIFVDLSGGGGVFLSVIGISEGFT